MPWLWPYASNADNFAASFLASTAPLMPAPRKNNVNTVYMITSYTKQRSRQSHINIISY